MLVGPAELAWVLVAAFASAIIGGLGGFGTGIVLTAVLAPIIGIKAVVPVLSLAGVLINVGRFWFYRRSVDWPVARRVLAAAVPCLFVGTWIYAALDARPLSVLIGAVVIASVPLRRVLERRRIVVGPRGLLAGGAAFGLANGFASGMGVILISVLMGTGLAGATVIATDALVTIFVDVLRASLFGKFALLGLESALLGVLIGLVTFPGSWLASVLVTRLHAHLHRLFMESLIVVGGALIVANALRSQP